MFDPETPETPEVPVETPETPAPEGLPPEGEQPAGTEVVPEQTPAAPPETPPAAAPVPAPVDPVALRQQIMDKTGFSEEQLRYVDQLVNVSVAPYQEKTAWAELKEARPDVARYKSQIDAELKNYPQGSAGDRVLLEKIYWMEKGKSMEWPSNQPRRPVANAAPAGGEVLRRSVSGGFSEGQDASARAPVASLSPQEKVMAGNFGMSEKEYDHYKVNRAISSKSKPVYR